MRTLARCFLIWGAAALRPTASRRFRACHKTLTLPRHPGHVGIPLKRLAFFLAFSSLLAGQQNPSAAPHLIIVSIDGLMPSTIRDAEKLGLKIPNLREFRDNGAFAQGLRGVMPTVTYPSHTTMMTGREPAQHGIISNELFDPDQRLDHAWYWYAESIKTPTLWDMARSKGLTTAGVSWPVTVGAHIDFNLPEYRAIATEEQLMLYRSLSTPGLMAEFEKRSGPIAAGERRQRTRPRCRLSDSDTKAESASGTHLRPGP